MQVLVLVCARNAPRKKQHTRIAFARAVVLQASKRASKRVGMPPFGGRRRLYCPGGGSSPGGYPASYLTAPAPGPAVEAAGNATR
jgi:hypothetical protein